MLLNYPKTIVIFNKPFLQENSIYVAMDLDGCYFNKREYKQIIKSPFAYLISEDQYNQMMEQEQSYKVTDESSQDYYYYYYEPSSYYNSQQPYNYQDYQTTSIEYNYI